MFFWNSLAFSRATFQMDVGNLSSASCAFSKSSLNIWMFTVHVLLKPGLDNFEHYLASVWDECNCTVVWHCLSLGLEWKLTVSSPVATTEFSKFAGMLRAALSQHHLSGFEIAQLVEKEMAAHSGVLAWRIPWAEKRGRPWSMGLQRVRHDWSD